MKISITLFVLIFIISTGCSKTDKNSQNSELKSDQKTEQKTDQTKSVPDAGDKNKIDTTKTPSIEGLTYDIGSDARDLKYDGKISAGAKWKDKNGTNILILTVTEIKTKGDKRSAEIFAYNYIVDGGSNKLLWKMYDFIKDCEFDVTLNFIENSLTITDEDNNGIGESTIHYKMGCRSDVSPVDMKLIMHEGETKYAIRGNTRVEIKGQDPIGGEMNIDKSFESAPKELLRYAKVQWDKYRVEKY